MIIAYRTLVYPPQPTPQYTTAHDNEAVTLRQTKKMNAKNTYSSS